MTNLSAPLLSLTVLVPLLAAFFVARTSHLAQARNATLTALSVSFGASAWVLVQVLSAGGGMLADSLLSNWLAVDSLSAVLIVLFPALALVTAAAAPQRDADRRFLTVTLVVVSATLATYAAQNVLVLFAGWTGSLIPFLLRRERDRWFALSRYTLGASALALAVAIGAGYLGASHAGVADPLSLASLARRSDGGTLLLALVAASLLRTGLFPAHRGIAATLGGSGLLLSMLVMNGHQGLYLLARIVIPHFAAADSQLIFWLGVLALLSCLLLAVLGLAEKTAEGLLATVFVSHACALFVGLATRTPEGVTGALLQWLVLGVCSTVLIAVYRCLHVRTDGDITGSGFNGFAGATPRFAVMFALAALALAGLPGTLGFSGEDLLMHGALVAHGWFGAVLPIAIALNAWHVYRLFAILFMGEPRISPLNLRDALPRERVSLFAALAVLIWFGFAPGHAVTLREAGVRMILGTATTVSAALP